MDLLFKRSVMGTALATVIMVIFLKCNLIQAQVVDWCLYRYYSQALSWAAASSACEQKGLKLAVMTEQASYNFVTDLIKTTIKDIYPNVQSSMWIGLHKDYAGNLRHDDCKLYTAKDFNPTQNLHKSCVYLDVDDAVFKADDCIKAMPFLCKHEAYDPNKCFDVRTLGASKLAPVGGAHKRNSADDCSAICNQGCFGFKFDEEVKECTMMTYTADPVPGRPNPHYTKGLYVRSIAKVIYGREKLRKKEKPALLDIDAHNVVAAIEADELCSTAVAAGGPNNAVTTNVDAPDVTSWNTLQSSYGAVVDVQSSNGAVVDVQSSNGAVVDVQSSNWAVVDVTTDIADPSSSDLAAETSNVATTIIDGPVMLSSSSYQSSYWTASDTTTGISNHLSSSLGLYVRSTAKVIYGREKLRKKEKPDICTTSAFNPQPGSDSTCYCSCEEQNNETLSIQQLKEKVKQLREQLFIDKKDLSSWKRKLVSAEDKRTSAKGIGFIGAGILITVAVALVILDFPTLVLETKKLAKTLSKCRHEKHQSVKGNG